MTLGDTAAVSGVGSQNASTASPRSGCAIGASASLGSLWDREEFRRRAREIAKKAAGKKIVAPIQFREEDKQLLPEIMAFKRRSLEILTKNGRCVPEINKVIPEFNSEISKITEIAPEGTMIPEELGLELERNGKEINRDKEIHNFDDVEILSAKIREGQALEKSSNTVCTGDQEQRTSAFSVSDREWCRKSFRIPDYLQSAKRVQILIPVKDTASGMPIRVKMKSPVIRRDLEGDRGPGCIYISVLSHCHHEQELAAHHIHRTMDPEKQKEQGKKHMVDEGNSSAAENTTPMSKFAGGGSKPPVQKSEVPKYKPKFDPLEVSAEGEKEEEQEATSLGAAGNLTGAEERACQEP